MGAGGSVHRGPGATTTSTGTGPPRRRLGTSSAAAGAPAPAVVNVICPRCRCVVVPPAAVFQCPCGQLMTYSLDGQRVDGPMATGGAARDPAAAAHQAQAHEMLRQMSARHAMAAAEAARRETGVPAALLSLFPVIKWKSDTMRPEGADEELVSCRVCLLDYEDGEDVKTLPCMHRFHSPCIDRWLSSNRTCPCCKTFVDARTSFEVGS